MKINIMVLSLALLMSNACFGSYGVLNPLKGQQNTVVRYGSQALAGGLLGDRVARELLEDLKETPCRYASHAIRAVGVVSVPLFTSALQQSNSSGIATGASVGLLTLLAAEKWAAKKHEEALRTPVSVDLLACIGTTGLVLQAQNLLGLNVGFTSRAIAAGLGVLTAKGVVCVIKQYATCNKSRN